MVSLAGTDRMPMAAALLGFAGALPFVFFAGALWLPPPFPSVPFAFSGGLVYGAVILSFLGGIRWGTALGMGEGEHRSMTFAVSVLPALAGWVALALPPLLGVGTAHRLVPAAGAVGRDLGRAGEASGVVRQAPHAVDGSGRPVASRHAAAPRHLTRDEGNLWMERVPSIHTK